MRKKKGAIITLALAGVISVGGAVGLHASMERNMNEKQVAEVERKQEMTQEMSQKEVSLNELNQKDNNLDETNKNNTLQGENSQNESVEDKTGNQVWNEDEGIYLTEEAEIVANDEFGCTIAWDNCNISYMHYSRENQEDLGLGKLKPIIEDAVKKYAGEDLKECDMEIFLEVPYEESLETQNVYADDDIFSNIDVEELVSNCEVGEVYEYETEEGEIYEIKTEDGQIYELVSQDGEVYECMNCIDDSDSMPEEVRAIYGVESKCYQVHILTENHRYDIWVDSVTGLVTVFNHEDLNLGTFTNGWDVMNEAGVWDVMNETGTVYEVSEEEQNEFDSIIEDFITEELKLGEVEKFYAQEMGVNYIGTSGNNIRAYYNVICKTVDGSVIEVTFDIGEKEVTSFRTSVQYLVE